MCSLKLAHTLIYKGMVIIALIHNTFICYRYTHMLSYMHAHTNRNMLTHSLVNEHASVR